MMSSPEISSNRCASKALCCYRNTTSQLQVAQVSHDTSVMLERIVFPGDNWLFEASPEAQLRIHWKDVTGDLVMERASCDRYQVKQTVDDFVGA